MADARADVTVFTAMVGDRVEVLQPQPDDCVVVHYTKSMQAMDEDELAEVRANLKVLGDAYPRTYFIAMFGTEVRLHSLPAGPGHVLVLQAAYPLDEERMHYLRRQWGQVLGPCGASPVVLDGTLSARAVRCPRCSTVCVDDDPAVGILHDPKDPQPGG